MTLRSDKNKNDIWLGLDTALGRCDVYLRYQDPHGHLVYDIERDTVMGRGQDGRLPQLVDRLLKKHILKLSHLDGVRMCIGPGRFTAIRLGMAYALGLKAAKRDIQVEGVSSLMLLAQASVETDNVINKAIYSAVSLKHDTAVYQRFLMTAQQAKLVSDNTPQEIEISALSQEIGQDLLVVSNVQQDVFVGVPLQGIDISPQAFFAVPALLPNPETGIYAPLYIRAPDITLKTKEVKK